MDAARREKRAHGTSDFPFQIYPALDGSEALDSDYIPYHWHPEWEIITVEAGRVSLTIADHEYDACAGDVFFVAAEQLHEIRAAGRENQFRSFVFSMDFLQFAREDAAQEELLQPLTDRRLYMETCLPADSGGQREIGALLRQILEACRAGRAGYQLTVKAALLQIIARCAAEGRLRRAAARPSLDYKANQLKEIVSFLGTHFAEPLTLDAVAGRFGLSPQYFCTFFRDNFGKTLTQHINSLRLEQAARLLRETETPVMEIGFAVGFENFSYFIKRFRAIYGVSPSVYRKRRQGGAEETAS